MINNRPIKSLIVDDELHACRNLDNILTEFLEGELEVCGYAHTFSDAATAIKETEPQLVFLDIEMNEGNTFQLLEKMGAVNFEIIFVTAYEEYALRALKLNVVDYLLKPIDITELRFAVKKVKEKLLTKQVPASNGRSEDSGTDTIVLRDNHNNYVIVALKDIIFIEALRSYAKIVYQSQRQIKELIMSKSISEYEDLLPQSLFIRIHRSFLVNYRHVKLILSEEQMVVLSEKDIKLPISRRRYPEVFSFLKGKKK